MGEAGCLEGIAVVSEKPPSRFANWRRYVAGLLLIGLVYEWYFNEERFWRVAALIGGIFILLGYLANFLLPFVDLASLLFRKPPSKPDSK